MVKVKAAEHYVEEYFNFYKLKYTILRFGSLYGERELNMTMELDKYSKIFIKKNR